MTALKNAVLFPSPIALDQPARYRGVVAPSNSSHDCVWLAKPDGNLLSRHEK